ncbi:polymerase III polypeptide H [Cyathus striatus]|nr:polymerase III polypeptide H [Cyathus striatus]
MFCLSIIKDTIPIHPSQFGASAEDAITFALNAKYSNRVLHDVGLCICVFDLTQLGEGKVRYGDGLLWYKVVFRLVVFRPFISEVIVAKVQSSDEDGIRLSLPFFTDVYCPASYLPQPCTFDSKERAWFWAPDFSLPRSPHPPRLQEAMLKIPAEERMYVDAGEAVRVRVEAEEWCDDDPGPSAGAAGQSVAGGEEKRVKRAPYSILCSMSEQGLGPILWWNNATQVEEGEGDVDMEEG